MPWDLGQVHPNDSPRGRRAREENSCSEHLHFLFRCWFALCSDVVVNLNHAIRKGVHGTQCQRHLVMPWRDEWNAFPYEDWYNAAGGFVDNVSVQKRRDGLPASHHPDVLARLVAEAFSKRTNRLRDE